MWLRYRVPIKQEIDENDTGHYEGRIVDKRIGGQDCATFPFESCERKKRTCDSSYNFIQWRSHPSSPNYCSVEHVPTHTGNTGIMIVEVTAIVDVAVISLGPLSRTVSPSSN